jgi:hypothetical protein
MTTILWTIYWTVFAYTLMDCTIIALLPDKDRDPHIKSLSVLLTSAVWPLGHYLAIRQIIRLARTKDNG